jgi:membrane-associated protease RseP (regulator of RpoE activity)
MRAKLKRLRQRIAIGRFAVLYITLVLIVIVLGVILFVTPTLQKHKGWIGIQVRQDTTSATLIVDKVLPGSPAEQVGILVGDRILSYDGIPVSDIDTFKELIRGSYIRQLVRIIIERNGARLVADTRIAHSPKNGAVLPPIIPIVQGVPRPHPDRGVCTNCHTLVPPPPR